MIIYGYKNRPIEIASGQFVCPRCDADRTYKHIDVIRYFTLFIFIQLFPLGRVTQYIECTTCARAFKPEEITGTRGNEQLVADIAARKAANDRKNTATRGSALLIIGGIIAVVSLCMLATLAAFQLTYDPTDPFKDIMGTFLMAAICPLPLLLLGIGLAVWGMNTQRSISELPTSSSMP